MLYWRGCRNLSWCVLTHYYWVFMTKENPKCLSRDSNFRIEIQNWISWIAYGIWMLPMRPRSSWRHWPKKSKVSSVVNDWKDQRIVKVIKRHVWKLRSSNLKNTGSGRGIFTQSYEVTMDLWGKQECIILVGESTRKRSLRRPKRDGGNTLTRIVIM